MTTATMTNLGEPQARVLNVLYDHADNSVGMQYTRLMFRADLDGAPSLVPVAESNPPLISLRDTNGNAVDLSEASEAQIINTLVRLTDRGTAWVEDNPRNSLLRRIKASPGVITIRRAMQHADGARAGRRLIHEVIHDGYVSMHYAEGREEVSRFLLTLHRVMTVNPDDYLLLPTPKIRKVLG